MTTDANVRRRGLGSPKEFHCPKCRSRVVKPTGKKRPYTPAAGHALGTRGNLEAAEYLCECGHNGWTNHNDIVKEPNMMKGARIYFYDSDRPQGAKEIAESPHNKARFEGFKNPSEDGRSTGGIILSGPQGPVTVSRADFPEATGTVRGKLWMPGKEAEWISLDEQGLVDVETVDPSPGADAFAAKAEETRDPAMAAVNRGKRIANILDELKKLGISDEALAPIRKEVDPF